MALTQITEKGIKDGEIINADINASAAIAGTKIAPDFGSQNVVTTGSIGIGIGSQTPSTPQKQLHIAHDSSPRIMLSNDTTGHATPNGTELLLDSGGNFEILQRENLNLEFFTNNSQRMTITGSGDVGIGTASPDRTIHCHNSSNTTNVRAKFSNGTTGEGASDGFEIGINGSDPAQAVLVNYENSPMAFFTNATERFRIDGSGQVGMGTSSPVQQAGRGLHINGTDQTRIKLTNASSGATANDGFDIIQENGLGIHLINHENADIKFGTNASERMRITSAGSVGIGGTAPNYQLHATTNIAVGAHGFAQQLLLANNSIQSQVLGTGYTNLSLNALGGNVGIGTSSPNSLLNLHGVIETNAFDSTSGSGGRYTPKGLLIGDAFTAGKTSTDDRNSIIWNERGLDIDFATSDTVRMKIDSSGNFMVGTTAADGDGLSIRPRQAHGTTRIIFNRADTSDLGTAVQFLNNSSTVGTIRYTNSATSYNTSSDYRLKENATAISDGIARLKTLKPYRFNFKVNPSTTVDGFFAHEVTAVPEAISGTKDEVDSDNNPVYQGIDQSKIVPLLTAALQEAVGKIETLETKVAALELA